MSSSAPATNRSAHAAIAGFDYQFDNTVLAILNASPNSHIDIEGIEDFDVHELTVDTAVQVKYFEAGRYSSPKSLRDPIALMLDHFKTGANWQYVLHVYFGDFNNMPKSLSLQEMKNCLTKTVQATQEVVELFEGLDDNQLQDFCDRLSIRPGVSFADQEAKVVSSLAAQLRCSSEEVEAIYLAKAREFVHVRARSPDASVRRVKAKALNDHLQVRDLLYRRWNLEVVGREKYLRAQTSLLKRTGFAAKNVRRALILSVSESNISAAADLCRSLSDLHLKSRRLKTAKPWLVAIDADADHLQKLKASLIEEGIAFNDGYEAIQFSPKQFDAPPVINVKEGSDQLKTSSYSIRIIAVSNLKDYTAGGHTVSRLIVCQEPEPWHSELSGTLFSLREFEIDHLSELMEAIA